MIVTSERHTEKFERRCAPLDLPYDLGCIGRKLRDRDYPRVGMGHVCAERTSSNMLCENPGLVCELG